MIRRCAEVSLPEPEFEAAAGFITRIWRSTGGSKQLGPIRVTTQDATRGIAQEDPKTTQQPDRTTQETGEAIQEVGGKTDSMPTRDRILALLRSDPTLTRAALASLVGVTPEGVKYYLGKLRKAGRIRHVGPTKKGLWEILESESTRPCPLSASLRSRPSGGSLRSSGTVSATATSATGGTGTATATSNLELPPAFLKRGGYSANRCSSGVDSLLWLLGRDVLARFRFAALE